jgi:hypothetical protein
MKKSNGTKALLMTGIAVTTLASLEYGKHTLLETGKLPMNCNIKTIKADGSNGI